MVAAGLTALLLQSRIESSNILTMSELTLKIHSLLQVSGNLAIVMTNVLHSHSGPEKNNHLERI